MFTITRPRTNGACVTVRGDIYDADDRKSSSGGDEHGSFVGKEVCYDNGWKGLHSNPTAPYTHTVKLIGGKIGIVPSSNRTKYTVSYTIKKYDQANCGP